MTRAVVTPIVPGSLPAPSGLSPWARGVWEELTRLHDFQEYELIPFERALRWWDASDAAMLDGKPSLAMDLANAALRHWKTLKFPPPPGARRPGRPSGENWSHERQAAARGRR
jgi:hypothetical protein